MANSDRISEVYKGEIWAESTQQVARDRIHWLVGQATGDVLDIGCSQGIISILCAREGMNVLGVDIQADRIEYAETGARYEYLNLMAGEAGEGLSPDELRAICQAFSVTQTVF